MGKIIYFLARPMKIILTPRQNGFIKNYKNGIFHCIKRPTNRKFRKPVIQAFSLIYKGANMNIKSSMTNG